jgi:3',5'-cyclic AMP phosphodiesterase CpdA
MAGDRATILHFSDLHFGPPLVPSAPEELRCEVLRHRPDVVAVSGDLTQRAKPRQFQGAGEFLRSLGVPWIAVPGNHDVPLYPVHRRLFTPYRQFRLHVSRENEPTAVVGPAVLAGFDSTAPLLRIVEGEGGFGRAERWGRRMEQLPEGKVRIALLHHPLSPSPGEGRKHQLRGAGRVAACLAAAGCRLVLGGHLHVSFLRDAGELWPAAKGMWIAQSGTSGSTRGRLGDSGARSYNRVLVEGNRIEVERWRSEGRAFELVERREIPSPAGDGAAGSEGDR